MLNLQLRDLPGLQVFAFRCLVASILLALFAIRARPLLTPGTILRSTALGVFLIAAPVVLLTQAPNISPGLAILLFAMTPLLAAVAENVVNANHGELTGAPYMLGGLLGIAFLVRGTLSFSASQGLSVAYIALAVLAVALSMVKAKQWLRGENLPATIAIQLLAAAVTTGLFSLHQDGATFAGWQRSSFFWLLMLSMISSALAYVLFYRLLAEYRASQLSALQWIIPVISLSETAAYIHHLPAWDSLAGGAVALICAILLLRSQVSGTTGPPSLINTSDNPPVGTMI